MTPRVSLLAAVALVASLASVGRADEPPIIAKARAYIGSEAALNAVRSVHFFGKITSADPANSKQASSAAVDIIFQKPWQHRIILTTPHLIRTIALDDYDVWQRVQDPADPRKSQVAVLTFAMLNSLRADVWENLAFYRGIEQVGGSVEDQGPATMDGVACEKVAFIHSPTIIFYRYFDLATGRLVYTETASGFQITEQGDRVVDGLRFPTGLVTKHKNAAGVEQTTTYQFDTIAVNETFSDSTFAIPPPEPPEMPSAAPATPPPLPASPAPAPAAAAPASP